LAGLGPFYAPDKMDGPITFNTFSLDRSQIDVNACFCRTRKGTLRNVEVMTIDKVIVGAHDNLS